MSTYFADENTKQIAVRKVFGADVSSETWRNVRSYMILTGIACLIGIPLAIAFGTVLWQVLKAAKTNPAIELKKE